MTDSINSWIQSKLSGSEYAKFSEVDNVLLSDGNRYVRIPGYRIDNRNIYYKNADGNLISVGDIAHDGLSYTSQSSYGAYFDYFDEEILSDNVNGNLYANVTKDGVDSIEIVVPNYVEDVYHSGAYSSVYTVSNGETVYVGQFGVILSNLYSSGKAVISLDGVNDDTGDRFRLSMWYQYYYDEPYEVSRQFSPIQSYTRKVLNLNVIPAQVASIDSSGEYDISKYSDYTDADGDDDYGYTQLDADTDGDGVKDFGYPVSGPIHSGFRASHDEYSVDVVTGYPVIGMLCDTFQGVRTQNADEVMSYTIASNYGYDVRLHQPQPMILMNKVDKTITLTHAVDIIARSVIDFGDGSAPVVIYSNGKHRVASQPISTLLIGSGYDIDPYNGRLKCSQGPSWNDAVKMDDGSFSEIKCRERDYRGEHTYTRAGTYVITIDTYYFGNKLADTSSYYNSDNLYVYKIHSTKEVVIQDNEQQDLIYFKIPKEIPNLYVNGYRCPVVQTTEDANIVALNFTGYDWVNYGKILSRDANLANSINYANLRRNDEGVVLPTASDYEVYTSSNIPVITKASFRVAVCEIDDVRNDPETLLISDFTDDPTLESIREVFGEECAVANKIEPIYGYGYDHLEPENPEDITDKMAVLGPQCIGKTYDLRNAIEWQQLWPNYYTTDSEVVEG